MDGMPVPKNPSQQIAEKLYHLQKRYLKNMLLGNNAQQLQQQFIDYLFNMADKIQLKQLIALEQLLGVVEAQVYRVNLTPQMLGMIGEIAQHLHQELSQNHAPLSSLISDQQVEHWLRKFLELENILAYIRRKIAETPQIRILCAYWINQNIERHTPQSLSLLSEKAKAKLPPHWRDFINMQQHKIEEKVEEKAAQLFQQQLLYLLSLNKTEYLNLGLSLWDNIKDKEISEFVSQSSALDSEDIFILLYELWKDIRKNPSVQNMIQQSIQYFYQTFADESIFYLFQSTGLKVTDIQNEAQRFAPDIIARLEQLNIIDQLIDLFIQPFFADPTTLAGIDACLADNSEQ